MGCEDACWGLGMEDESVREGEQLWSQVAVMRRRVSVEAFLVVIQLDHTVYFMKYWRLAGSFTFLHRWCWLPLEPGEDEEVCVSNGVVCLYENCVLGWSSSSSLSVLAH